MANEKERRQWYIEHGICVACGQRDAFMGRQKCPECLEKANNSNALYRDRYKEQERTAYGPRRKAKRQARIAAGLCPNCGKPAVHGQLCARHYAKKRQKHEREKQERAMRGDPRRERVEAGLCWFCDQPALDGYRVCRAHYADILSRFERGGREHPWSKAETARIADIRRRSNDSGNT